MTGTVPDVVGTRWVTVQAEPGLYWPRYSGDATSMERWEEVDAHALTPLKGIILPERHDGDPWRGGIAWWQTAERTVEGGLCAPPVSFRQLHSVKRQRREQVAGVPSVSNANQLSVFEQAHLVELAANIEHAWDEGKAVCFATDGSHTLECRRQDGVIEWRAQVSSSWVWGITETSEHALDETVVRWMDIAFTVAAPPDGAKLGPSVFHDRKPSNWDGELYGIIGALRLLRQLPWTILRRGAVKIWSDSQAIEKVLARVKTEKEWRSLTCTQAWLDIRTMIQDWELAGGTISVLWTASHAEKRTSDRSKWTSIEVGNDLADKAALRARTQTQVLIEGDDQMQVKRGGIWRYRNADLELMRLDGPLKQTWKQLAGRHHLREMNKTRAYNANNVDERVLLWPKAAYAPLPFAFFRTQLIYGQLPSARVWHRNHKIAGPEAEICTLCQKQGKFKTDIWHILAECPAPGLIEIRRRHQTEVHRFISSQFSKMKALRAAILLGFKYSSGENGCLSLQSDGVTADTEEIIRAAGQCAVQTVVPGRVENEERPRRGEIGPQPSPWFGIFPRSWLDSGAQEIGVQEGRWRDDLGKEVNSLRRSLAGLSKLTIAGCRATWQVAGGLWAEVNRQEQQFLQAAHKVAIVVELRREAADREVLGAKAMWRAQEARAARRAAARRESLKGGKVRTARTFPVEWVAATWRAYGKAMLETGEKRRRRKNPTLGKQISMARQQSIGESIAIRDRALGWAAQPVKLSSSGKSKRPREEMQLIRSLFKRPKHANGVG